uniref:Transposase n=1 Tax=Haemonchus contortus TaxID=6289 RepID=W6NRC1_HAECO
MGRFRSQLSDGVDSSTIASLLVNFMLSDISAKEAQAKIVDTYGADAISYDTCKTWIAKFKRGDFSLQDAPGCGRPMELDLKLLQSTVEEDPYATTRELAAMLGHAQSTVESRLEKIAKVAKLGRWIPHQLTDYDIMRRVDTRTSLRTLQKKYKFRDTLITGDEKWVPYKTL